MAKQAGRRPERQRAQGERLVFGVREETQRGRDGPQAACPVFVYNRKPLFDVAPEPLLQTRLLLLQDVPRCQTQTRTGKLLHRGKRSGHWILSAHYLLLLGRSSLRLQKLHCFPAKPSLMFFLSPFLESNQHGLLNTKRPQQCVLWFEGQMKLAT